MMYYSNDYLCHYGVLGMKWGQHIAARSQAKATRKAKIAKGKAMSSKGQLRLSKALNAANAITGATAALTVGNKIASKTLDQGWQVVKQEAMSRGVSDLVASNMAFKAVANGINGNTVAAGALALAAIGAAVGYAESKHLDNNMYVKKANSATSK